MKPIKGLAQDTRPENQQEGTYPFGKNGIQFDLKGTVTNEKGFKLLTGFVDTGYGINGIISTDDSRVIVFHTNNVNSRITLYDTKTETIIYQFDDSVMPYKLGFKIENYITGQTQRNYIGELVCAFTDKVEFPKHLNLDNPDTGALKNWNLFPECSYPVLSTSIIPGGLLKVGSYFFAGRYFKQDGTKTSFSNVSAGIAMTSVDGTDTADKAIRLALTNLDIAYDFYEIAVIKRVNGVTTAELLTKIPIVSSTYYQTYSGESLYEVITLEEVLTSNVYYDKVQSITQLNDALYVGGLERSKDIYNMQPYANMIKMFWKSELIDATSAPEEHKSGIKKSFKHGETYAFYIKYRLTNGSFTVAYHIPGPEMPTPLLAVSTVGTAGGVTTAPIFKAEDNITVFSSTSLTGLCGPYQNYTEVYPNTTEFDSSGIGGTDIRNTPVRHHRMPSIKWCRENLYASDSAYGSKKLDLLGIQPSNIIIPTEYLDRINGYEIFYAKRTIENMTNYGQSLLLYSSFKTDASGTNMDPSHVYSVGHNFDVHTTSAGWFKTHYDYARFHGFDYLFNKPSIKPAFIASQVKLTGFLSGKYSAFAGTTYTGNSVHLVDMTLATTADSPANNINNILESKALTHNINNGEWYNNYLESALALKLSGAVMPMPTTLHPYDPGANGNFSGTSFPVSYLVDLYDLKDDIYTSFYAQDLISAGDAQALSSTNTNWKGDVFVGLYTYHTYGYADNNWQNYYDDGAKQAYPEHRGRRIVNRIVCETVANLYTRYEIPGNIYSKWYDHNSLSTVVTLVEQAYPAYYSGFEDPNQFGYSKGSEAINDLVVSEIYNPYRTYQTKFPYRVHRGGKLSRQTTRSWKTFLALDYYEIQKNMGTIQHLEGMDDRLLIHCENALFVTQDKAKLNSGLLGVTLGSGDIFQFEPQESLSSKLGYAGTQHDLACIRTPIGYVFVDSKQGEIYLYKPTKEQPVPRPLNNLLHRFLKEYLNIYGNNPFMANGITLGWDERYKRIFATVKNVRPDIDTPILVINSAEDIPDTIQAGDIIFYQGKYIRYVGTDITPYTCPPDECECATISALVVTLLENQITSYATWTGDAPFIWVLNEVTFVGSIPVASGTTNSTFLEMPQTLAGKVYSLSIYASCEQEGCVSVPVEVVWATQVENPDGLYCLHLSYDTAATGSVPVTISLKDMFGATATAVANISITFYKVNAGIIGAPITWTLDSGNTFETNNITIASGDYFIADAGQLGTILDPTYCGFGTYEPLEVVTFYITTNLEEMGSFSDTIDIDVVTPLGTFSGSTLFSNILATGSVTVNMPASAFSGTVDVTVTNNIVPGGISGAESGAVGTGITITNSNFITITYS